MTDNNLERQHRKREASLAIYLVLAALGFQAVFDGITNYYWYNNPTTNALAHIVDGIGFIVVAGVWLRRWVREV